MTKPDTAQALRAAADAIERQDEDELLGTEATSKMLGGISLETLKHWRQQRTGPPWLKVGRYVMYRRGALRAWIREQEALSQQAS